MDKRGPVPIKLYKREIAETLQVGPMTVRVYEDGSLTENRVSAITVELPAGGSGPPMHWHRFHDEVFLVTKGTITFVTPDGDVEAKTGDIVTVPPRAIHTFKNVSEQEDAEFYMTATPAQYVDYFRILAKELATGKKLEPSTNHPLMALYGTFPPDVSSEP